MRTALIPKASSLDPPSSSSSKRPPKWAIKKPLNTPKAQGKTHDQEQEQEEELSKRRPASRFRSAVAAVLLASLRRRSHSVTRVTGTLYGHRRGHVHLAFQTDPRSPPTVLLQLATSTSSLVREMASGLVRIALECERSAKAGAAAAAARPKLTEEGLWRAYCNGRKCGFAVRREAGAKDLKVMKAVEMVTMGAGVLPKAAEEEEEEGEVMFMRARFERVVGSRDSEAFYMMNPDGNGGGTELSVYLLRV